jgi:NAD(P)-dependent dehydrogenase (short-subunit alcohol dehydrogenase family)
MHADKSVLRDGDLVVVTGAAQGIGRAVALRLARMGSVISLWDTSRDGVEETADLCRRAGGSASALRVDVSDWAEVRDAAVRLATDGATPFGLVNNAGIFPRALILDADPAIWLKTLQVNLLGAVHCVKALVPSMVAVSRGSVITIASGRALQGTPRGAHYAASKAGLISFTKSLALEMAPHGIRANSVIPGVTETAQPLQGVGVEELRRRGERIPLGRIGQPEDVAGIVAFLMSDDARYMTGQAVVVNGGAQMLP